MQEYPVEIHSNLEASFWLIVHKDNPDFDDYDIEVLSIFPSLYKEDEVPLNVMNQHSIDYEIEEIGIDYLLGLNYGENIEQFIEENKMPINKPFKIRMKVEYIGCYDGDYDMRSDWNYWSTTPA